MRSLKAMLFSSFALVGSATYADEKVANPLHAQGQEAQILFEQATSEITPLEGHGVLYEIRDVDGHKCTKISPSTAEGRNPVFVCR